MTTPSWGSGYRVASFYTDDKEGITRVKPKHTAKWEERLTKLGQVLEEYLVDSRVVDSADELEGDARDGARVRRE